MATVLVFDKGLWLGYRILLVPAKVSRALAIALADAWPRSAPLPRHSIGGGASLASGRVGANTSTEAVSEWGLVRGLVLMSC